MDRNKFSEKEETDLRAKEGGKQMVLTNTEYMSDPARADRVIRKFMNMTLRELGEACRRKDIYWIGSIADDMIASAEDLSVEKTQDMTYLEFACLIEHMGENPGYDEREDNRRSMQQFFYKLAAQDLMEGNKTSIPIRLFMALPLKVFYASLAGYAEQNRVYTGIKTTGFYGFVKDCSNYSGNCTIGDFLSRKIDATGKAWEPLDSLEKYEEEIRTAHADIGELLMGSFSRAFSSSLYVADILNKYRASAVCEGGEDRRKEEWKDRQAG